MKRIAVAFLGNLFYDTRTYNLFHSLRTRGHAVHFYGFDWETPGFQEVRRPDICIRKLRKRRFSILFYIRFAWGTAAALMRNRSDIYIASDFFTLAFCTLAARYWHADLVYDSREVYSEMPGIYDKPLLKRLVLWVERLCAPSAACVLATGEMDAEFIRSRLGIRQVRLLRNLPQRQSVERVESYRGRFPTPVKGTVLIYQGILVPGRGIETMLEVLQKMPSSGLVILGEGVMSAHYKRAVSALGLEDRVFFAGKIPQAELLSYTAGGDVGLCLIQALCHNNLCALPNKLFEYVMAGLPVIATDLPQMRKVVDEYGVGAVVPENDADAVANVLRTWETNPKTFQKLRANCRRAINVLNWETEFAKVYESIVRV